MKGGDRPTRLLRYAKMLLVPKTFFPFCLVDYALEGSGQAAYFTLRGNGTHIGHTDLLWFLFPFGRICPLISMQEQRALIFSKVLSGPE